ncbi:zinc finger protein 3-like, partial [Trifolium medium]|nr:zinc finger protein 3-like [Trifolium medium]
MPSWAIGSPSNGYGGLHMSNSSPTTPQFPMQMPNPSLTIPQFGMTNFRGGGQNVALPIPQRSNTLGLGLFAQANQIPSIAEGTERNFNAQFRSQTLPLLSHIDPIGGDLIQINHNISSPPTQSTSEALN